MTDYRYAAISGFEGHYEIRDDGVVFSIKSGTRKPLKSIQHGTGYLTVNLCIGEKHRKTFRVHKLVGLAFISNPRKLDSINHKDLNKRNNHYENLEWVTHQENTDHAIAAGAINFSGVNNPATTLTKDSLQYALNRLRSGLTIFEVSQELKVGRNAIPKMLKHYHGSNWKALIRGVV